AYGRFGFDCIESDTRVTAPMKRVGDELKETTWEDALAVVAAELKKAGENAGIIASAGMLNEDALTLKNFASGVVKTKNVDTTASLYGSAATLLHGSADLDAADLFVLVDLNPSQKTRALPALDALIRRKVNGGARLITVNAAEPAIASVAAVRLSGDEAESLKALVKALADKGAVKEKSLVDAVSGAKVSEAVEQAASLFAAAHHPVVISSSALYNAAANLGLVKGSAIAMPLESNAKGVMLMGLAPAGRSYREMVQGGTGLLYAIGEVPLSERPLLGFLVVQSSHLTPLARQADVVLPSAAFMEAEGTMVDYAGRVKYVAGVVAPAGDARTHREIFAALAEAMGVKIPAATESEARSLAQPKSRGTVGAFARTSGFDVTAEEVMESVNASVINGSRLLWLKEAKVRTASAPQPA
ncbi:MAG: molybdopterin-dependent oxidoreductase, partial [Nitrospirales bacterium]|nr:molybdopterin-dependent oxidoreductase [Nitrospirales bacterium]